MRGESSSLQDELYWFESSTVYQSKVLQPLSFSIEYSIVFRKRYVGIKMPLLCKGSTYDYHLLQYNQNSDGSIPYVGAR